MAEFEIKVSQEEKEAVITAIKQLVAIPHIKKMSQAMIADTACIKATKIRAILQELIDEGKINQYAATDNPKLQRYLYTVNDMSEYEKIADRCHSCKFHIGIISAESYCEKEHDCRDKIGECEDYSLYSPGC